MEIADPESSPQALTFLRGRAVFGIRVAPEEGQSEDIDLSPGRNTSSWHFRKPWIGLSISWILLGADCCLDRPVGPYKAVRATRHIDKRIYRSYPSTITMYSVKDMEWLNYHHLYYFWTVAKEGAIVRACEKLHVAQPTISGQLRQFEESLGEKLFVKSGRGLVLTDTGQVVYRYAEEIFSVGHELLDVLRGRPRGRAVRFLVGVSDVMPKLMVFRALQAVLKMPEPVHLVCYEGDSADLLLKLSSHGLDMILTDSPVTAPARTRTYNHELGSCGVTFCATLALATGLRRNFPASLDGAPFLLPIEGAVLRRSLEQWFDRHRIRPSIIGEFEDSALLKVFGQSGAGVFAIPSAVEKEVRAQYGVAIAGRTNEIVERFYAVSVERRLKHPAVVAVSEAARQLLHASATK